MVRSGQILGVSKVEPGGFTDDCIRRDQKSYESSYQFTEEVEEHVKLYHKDAHVNKIQTVGNPDCGKPGQITWFLQ